MTLVFLLMLAMLGFAMKLIVLLLPCPAASTRWAFVLSPFVTPDMLRRWIPVDAWRAVYSRCAASIVALALLYKIYLTLADHFEIRGVALSYMAVPVLLLAGQPLVALVSLFWLPAGRLLPPLHNRPELARGLADFWGHRWNLWFSRWFRLTIFDRIRSRPRLALIAVFFVSGLMHEWVVNLPLHLVTHRNLFGSMMIYFLLQPAGILFEKRFLKHRPTTRMALAWAVVVVPVPLLLNEGLLRVLLLWP